MENTFHLAHKYCPIIELPGIPDYDTNASLAPSPVTNTAISYSFMVLVGPSSISLSSKTKLCSAKHIPHDMLQMVALEKALVVI
jgi:hypothetical protein